MPPARSAVLGAGGYIGQEFVRRIADHPFFEAPLLVGGDRSVGRTLGELWQLTDPPPEELAQERLRSATPRQVAERADVAFSALPSGSAGPFEEELARRGCLVFSNAADHRMDPTRPLLVPEVNPDHLGLVRAARGGRAPIITNPNCSAAGLVVALAPLVPILAPRAVHVATYQALSGAGYPGVPSLSITDNVIPFVAEEEEKIALEAPRILGRRIGRRIRPSAIRFVPQCARVGTRDGHLEAVTIEARRRPSEADLLEALRGFDPLADLDLPTAPHPPIELRVEPDRPQPLRDRLSGLGRTRGMTVVVGRIRWSPPYLRFFLLSHNAIRGGAGGSILNAELAHARGLW